MVKVRRFVIGDTHFGHRNILKFEAANRPFNSMEEHDETLVCLWNQTVTPEDIVYHLGDVFFRRESIKYVRRLNGRKILIMGNHDHYVPVREYGEVFERVCGVVVYKKIIMTHYPIHPYLFYKHSFNIHGHMHSKKLDDPRYINVSVEHTALRPKLLSKVIEEAQRAIQTNPTLKKDAV